MRGGYGLRLRGSDNGERSPRRVATRRFVPSVRTAATAVFSTMFVLLMAAIFFKPSHQRKFLQLIVRVSLLLCTDTRILETMQSTSRASFLLRSEPLPDID